jgi:hypothetical protein
VKEHWNLLKTEKIYEKTLDVETGCGMGNYTVWMRRMRGFGLLKHDEKQKKKQTMITNRTTGLRRVLHMSFCRWSAGNRTDVKTSRNSHRSYNGTRGIRFNVGLCRILSATFGCSINRNALSSIRRRSNWSSGLR